MFSPLCEHFLSYDSPILVPFSSNKKVIYLCRPLHKFEGGEFLINMGVRKTKSRSSKISGIYKHSPSPTMRAWLSRTHFFILSLLTLGTGFFLFVCLFPCGNISYMPQNVFVYFLVLFQQVSLASFSHFKMEQFKLFPGT